MKRIFLILFILASCLLAESNESNSTIWRIESPRKSSSARERLQRAYIHIVANERQQVTKAAVCGGQGKMAALSFLSNFPKLKSLTLTLSPDFHLAEDAIEALIEVAGLETIHLSGDDDHVSKTDWAGLCRHKNIKNVIFSVHDRALPLKSIRSFVNASPKIGAINFVFRFFDDQKGTGAESVHRLRTEAMKEMEKSTTPYALKVGLVDSLFEGEIQISITSE